MPRKLLAAVASVGLGLAMLLGGATPASAEPSPGMARATYHCHPMQYPWFYLYCHTAVT